MCVCVCACVHAHVCACVRLCVYLLERHKSKHVFARTCPGGWAMMLPADTRRHTSLQPEADTSDCSLHRATGNLL